MTEFWELHVEQPEKRMERVPCQESFKKCCITDEEDELEKATRLGTKKSVATSMITASAP